jgi:rSAM/selenodomain-associated transferase 1
LSSCIFIMAKYPAVGEVKTRMGKSMGNEEAANLYLCFLRDTVEKVNGLGVPLFIYFTPEDRREEFQRLLGNDLTYVPQEGDDLGERLFNGFKLSSEMGYTSAIALASDAPDLPGSILDEAVTKLDEFDSVIGPSPDGGYYLIGLKNSAVTQGLFHGITWSTNTVYAETLARIKGKQISCHSLASWADVDHVDDLERLLSSSDPDFRRSHTWKYLMSRQINSDTA